MRGILMAAVSAAAMALVGASAANATTCKQRATNCDRLGGGAACFEASRMARCSASKIYTAPSGTPWEANGSPSVVRPVSGGGFQVRPRLRGDSPNRKY